MNNKLVFLIIFLPLLAYVTIRAALLGITYDEVWTLSTFVPLDIKDILLYNPADANNQLLNTLLIKLFYVFGNHSLFIARLPNVLAFVVFGYYCFRISKRSRSIVTGAFLLILLLYNPFVLDFFSLARGYGLAMAFQMGCLHYVMAYFSSYNWKKLALSFSLGILAVLSNFTFLYFFLSVFLFSVGSSFIYFKNNIKIGVTIIIAVSALLLLASIIAVPIIKLIMNGGFYYGGTDGFYKDTLVSLFAYILYHPYHTVLAKIVLNIFLFLAGSIIVYCFMRIDVEGEPSLAGKTQMISLLTGLIIIINLTNHTITGTPYLIDRTALLYIPLFIMSAAYWIEELQARHVNKIAALLFVTFCMLALVNFGINANFKKTISWPFEAHSEQILSNINAEGIKKNKVMSVDFSWPFEKSIGYYSAKNKYPNLTIIKDAEDREKLNRKADYYIYYSRSMDKVGYFAEKQLILNLRKDTVWKFEDEDVFVFTHLDTIAGGSR
jgi:hypothetical protein